MLFFIVAIPIYVPTNSGRGFPFLHTLSNIYCSWIFDDGHSDWCKMMRCYGFDLFVAPELNNVFLTICLLW